MPNKTISCYSTSTIIKYAQKKGISLDVLFEGIQEPFKILTDPAARTDAITWTRLAKNLESALGGKPGTLIQVAREILFSETNSFFLFFLRIAPRPVLLRNLARYIAEYSNKNIRFSGGILRDGEAIANYHYIDKTKFSKQMCDFNKGWTIATLEVRGCKAPVLTETTCSALDPDHDCQYKITWTPTPNFLIRIREWFNFRFRNHRAILRHMEENHQHLEKQYQEIVALKDSIEATRDFYEHIMSNANEGIVWLNERHEIVFVNPGFSRIVERAETSLAGINFINLFSGQNPHWRVRDLLARCVTMCGMTYSEEFALTTPDQEERTLEVTAKWIAAGRQKPGFLLNVRDVTHTRRIERKLFATENRYTSLYENSPALIVGLDEDGRFLYANPAMLEQSGYTEGELLQMSISALLGDTSSINPFVSSKGKLFAEARLQEVHFKTKAGGWKTAAFQTYPLYDDLGRVMGVSAIGVDITETKRLNEQLIRSQRMELLGQMAGGIAHDFHNIINSASGFCGLLQKDAKTDKEKKYLQNINIGLSRAHELTRNMLTFSRGGVNKRADFNLNNLIEEVKTFLAPVIPRDIYVLTELPDHDCIIKGDASKIHQCLMNLCINAKDAIEPKQGTITIRLREEREKGFALIEIQDTGSGIPPDIIDRIFDPFFTTKPKEKGTGLGLSVVYGVIRAHEGDITVDSRPGEGTLFRITLPTLAQKPQPSPALIATETKQYRRPSGTIMIIDDDSLVRSFCTDILHEHGCMTVQFGEAEEAIAWFAKNHADVSLVLADIMLPRMSGIDMVERLRVFRREIPAVYMTGFILPNTRKPAESDLLITKPFTPVKLIKTIEAAMAVV